MGALLSRLAKVEAKLFDPFGKRRGGVLWVPPIMSIDEWEAIAVPAQAALAAACMEDARTLDGPSLSERLAGMPDPDSVSGPNAAQAMRHRKKLINFR